MPTPKILLWDLECTNLSADFGHIVSGAFKTLNRPKTVCRSIRETPFVKNDPTDDSVLVETLRNDLSEADMWVTWYGERFDVPYLNSRLIYHGLKPLPPVPHVDLWRVSRNRLHIHSNRLASAAAFLGLEEKTPIKPDVWQKASVGHGPSIRYVEAHNIQDVIVLEQAYHKLKSLVYKHPNVNIMMGADGLRCPVCSSLNLIKRGYRVAQTTRTERLQCKDCGKYTSGKKDRFKNEAHD